MSVGDMRPSIFVRDFDPFRVKGLLSVFSGCWWWHGAIELCICSKQQLTFFFSNQYVTSSSGRFNSYYIEWQCYYYTCITMLYLSCAPTPISIISYRDRNSSSRESVSVSPSIIFGLWSLAYSGLARSKLCIQLCMYL